MLNQSNSLSESANNLKDLLDTTSECLEALTTLGIDVTTWDIIVIHIIVSKLDPESRRQWEFNITNTLDSELPTFKRFCEFMTNRFRALEFLEEKTSKYTARESRSYYSVEDKTAACLYCASDHKLSFCKRFSSQDIDHRRTFVHENGICFICLGKNHSAKFCKSESRCKICKGRHHSLLHPKSVSALSATVGFEAVSENNDDIPLISCCTLGQCRDTVLLNTALIEAESNYEGHSLVRALIDQGSQASFISESTVKFLGLNKTPDRKVVKVVGGGQDIISNSTVTLNIKSRIEPNFKMTVKAYVLNTVTTSLPEVKTTEIKWEQPMKKDLADPEYHTPNQINVLLGAEVYAKIIKKGVRRNSDGLLIAQATKLGWVISGISKESVHTSEN